MAKLIMWNLITLDGFFEGKKKWDLEWHNYVWGKELEQFSLEQLATVDALLFGRVTYEGMAAYWSTATGAVAEAMNAIHKIVFSRTLTRAGWNNTKLVTSDAAAEIVRLKGASTRNLFVFGSADLSATIRRRGLFDEYRLCVVPVVLGAGTPLFKADGNETKLVLRKARTLETGGVIMYCEPESPKVVA